MPSLGSWVGASRWTYGGDHGYVTLPRPRQTGRLETAGSSGGRPGPLVSELPWQARPDEEDVARLDPHPRRLLGSLQIVGEDGIGRLQPSGHPEVA